MKPNYRREVKEILSKIGLSKSNICEMLDITPATFYNWKNGDTSPSEADFERLKALAGGTFEGRKSGALVQVDVSDMIRLPVYGSVPAGPPEAAEQEAIGWHSLPKDLLKSNPKNSFVLKIRGDSMEPDLREGDLVVVNPNLHPMKGEVVVAQVDGGFTCKIWTGDPKKLRPLNPAHKDVCADQELRVIGVVVVEMKVSRVRKV